MACPHCGSWAVRSDRALAGRMVCARCGQPLGRAAVPRGRRQPWSFGKTLNGRPRLWLIALGLVAISAILASLDRPAAREPRPPAWGIGTPASP
ncbi:MAG: hypothetical protein VKI42_03880 [Synechococcaceae cyanobacterium]|nr:hypothetical protein [Synechococcaceae cyanobacterium]